MLIPLLREEFSWLRKILKSGQQKANPKCRKTCRIEPRYGFNKGDGCIPVIRVVPRVNSRPCVKRILFTVMRVFCLQFIIKDMEDTYEKFTICRSSSNVFGFL